jgi:hypothetical protein
MVFADGHVLGHVTPGLAQKPDWRTIDRLAQACSHEAAAVHL